MIFLQAGFKAHTKVIEVDRYGLEGHAEQLVVPLILIHVDIDQTLKPLNLLSRVSIVLVDTPIDQVEILNDLHGCLPDFLNPLT